MNALDKYFRYVRKDFIYYNYTNIILDFKKYEKISRKQMIEEVIKFYQKDPNRIIEICNEKQLKLLSKILNNKKYNKNDRELLHQLQNRFLCYTINMKLEKYKIVEELEETVKQALSQIEWKKIKEKDIINDRFVALMKLYGSIDTRELGRSYNIYYDEFDSLVDCVEYLTNNLYLRQFYYVMNCDGYKQAIYLDYQSYEEESYQNIPDDIYYKYFSKDEIESMIKCPYNIDTKYLKKIMNHCKKISSSNYLLGIVIDMMKRCADGGLHPQELEKKIRILASNYEDLEDFIEQIMLTVMNIPSMMFLGHSWIEYRESNQQELDSIRVLEQKEKLQGKTLIEKYQKIRKESNEALGLIEPYLLKNSYYIKSIMSAVEINKVVVDIVSLQCHIMTFSKIEENEKCLFEHFFEDEVNLSHEYYSIYNDIRNFRKQSLFKIEKMNREEGTVDLIDVKDNQKYTIVDISLSLNELSDFYIYTTLFFIDDIYITAGYSLPFVSDKTEDLLSQFEREMKRMRFVKDSEYKELLAACKLYSKGNIKIDNVNIV